MKCCNATNAWRETSSGGSCRRRSALLVSEAMESKIHQQRLADLRGELKRRGLDGFLVPLADEHQGEYVAERSKRLAWLTGFNGSAGIAVVLAETACVFIDGRYTVQAETEVDGALYQRRHLIDQPATDWIAENLTAGGRLGFDPWLHTPGQVERFTKACAKAGGECVATDGNPIDAVWADQPPPPLTPVTILDDAFTGEPAADKRRRIAEALSAAAVVLTVADSVAWILNVRGDDVEFTPFALSFAVLHADQTLDWFVDPRKLTPGLADQLGDAVRVRPLAELGDLLDGLGADEKTVQADPTTAASWVFRRLKAAGATVVREVDPCQLAKARKNPVQVQGMRDAHHRDGVAMARFLALLDSAHDLTEIAAADRLEALRREGEHFRGLSFPTISGAGANGAIVHYRVTPESDRKLEPGTLYLVDSGAQYLDGTTDVTRTIAIGAPTAAMRRHFTLVLKGHIGLARARFPKGTSGSQLDILARQALWQAGLDYDHGTGHGVGSYLSVHEGPQRITKVANAVGLEPGMVISNEPGYYKTGAYGIRIENLVVVIAGETPAGGEKPMLAFETLTLAPIDRRLVDADLLSGDERAWLDAYHARVQAALSDSLDAPTAAWLAAATAPIS